MKTSILTLLSILLALTLPLIGIALGLRFGRAWNAGSLARWERLPDPPASPVQIMGGATSQVFIKASDGQVYACTPVGGECWVQANVPVDLAPIDAACADHPISYIMSAPPGNPIDTLQTQWCHFEAGEQTGYAILADGSVWRWQHRDANFLNLARTAVTAAGGCLAGMLTGVLILFSAWLISRVPRGNY
jgi:hypothetical protein